MKDWFYNNQKIVILVLVIVAGLLSLFVTFTLLIVWTNIESINFWTGSVILEPKRIVSNPEPTDIVGFDCEIYDHTVCPIDLGCELVSRNNSMQSEPSCIGEIKHSSVIVTLNIPYEAEGYLTPDEVEKQRKLIVSTRIELLSEIPGLYEVYKEYTTLPNVAMKVDDEALEFLQESELVEAVSEDRKDPFNDINTKDTSF